MKKLVVFAIVMLMAGSAWAAPKVKEVKCEVGGKTQTVASVKACKELGGKIVRA